VYGHGTSRVEAGTARGALGGAAGRLKKQTGCTRHPVIVCETGGRQTAPMKAVSVDAQLPPTTVVFSGHTTKEPSAHRMSLS
jgi:hypothetical protein